MKRFLILAPLGLSACVSSLGGAGGGGAAPAELVEAVGLFARDGVVADIYAERCAASGVALLDPEGEDLPGKFATEMLMKGYLPDQIEKALRRKDPATIAAEARAYIAGKGLPVDGNDTALCSGAVSEARRSTGPGRFLTAS